MAGIGDYVHARLFRLDKYGLSTGPDRKKLVTDHSEFISSLTRQKTWVTSQTLEKKAKALEDIYNLKKIDGKALITDDQFETMHQNILKAIDQQFHEYMDKIEITAEGQCQLKVDSNGNKPLQIGLINDQLASNTINKLIALGEKINSLQNTLQNDGQIKNQAGEQASYTLAELQRDKSKLLKVFRQWFEGLSKNSTWSQTHNYIKNLEVGGVPINKFFRTYSMRGKDTNQAIGPAPIITKSGRKSRKKTVTEEMIKDCNELIAKYAQYTPLTAIQGLYNELYAQMMPEFIQQNVNSISEKLLKEFGDNMKLTNVGTASSETNILKYVADKVGGGFGKRAKIRDFKKAVETAIVSANSAASIDNYSSTSKADVVIEWGSKVSAGISVKSMSHNSNGFKYIKLVDGTNLLYYIGNWDRPFANTFLNLFATHVDDKNESRVKLFEEQKKTVSAFAVQTIAIQALTGYNLGRESSHMAQLFAYRNVENGKWTVVPTATIMDRIIENIHTIGFLNTNNQLGLKVEIGGKKISNLKLNNAWVGKISDPNYKEAKLRLATLIADMHSKKIYVSMQFSKYVSKSLKV